MTSLASAPRVILSSAKVTRRQHRHSCAFSHRRDGGQSPPDVVIDTGPHLAIQEGKEGVDYQKHDLVLDDLLFQKIQITRRKPSTSPSIRAITVAWERRFVRAFRLSLRKSPIVHAPKAVWLDVCKCR